MSVHVCRHWEELSNLRQHKRAGQYRCMDVSEHCRTLLSP